MREIEPCDDPVLVRCRGYLFDVEQLTREKVRPTKHDCRQLIGVLVYKIDNVFSSDCKLAFARSRQNESVLWIEPMMHDLGFDRISVRRERRLFHQDLEARRGWSIERGHHQMKIHSEAVHTDH